MAQASCFFLTGGAEIVNSKIVTHGEEMLNEKTCTILQNGEEALNLMRMLLRLF